MKGSFVDDATLSERLFELLDLVFPSVPALAQQARALGASWESVSTPFFHVEEGRLIAHVGVIELPLIVSGLLVSVGSIHAVATHPGYRRRGRYRQVMEEVLAYCADRYETLILTTEHPEYFEPFGFRRVQEYVFTVQRGAHGNAKGARILDTRTTEDITLLHRLLETRAPVSQVVGVIKEKAVFCFNEGSRPLHYVPNLDVVVCLERQDAKLKLFDIVGAQIPPLAALLEQLPQRTEEVKICFSPDRLAVDARATPYVFDHDGPSYLMVRGPFAAEGQAFTLPRSART